jgi:hypothetical protein
MQAEQLLQYHQIIQISCVPSVTGCGNMLGRCTDMNEPVLEMSSWWSVPYTTDRIRPCRRREHRRPRRRSVLSVQSYLCTGNCGCTSLYYWRNWNGLHTGSNSWSPDNCKDNVVPTELRCHQLLFLVSHRVSHTPQTVFDRVEDENIDVPEEDRYYPCRATYDIELRQKLQWCPHTVDPSCTRTVLYVQLWQCFFMKFTQCCPI